MKRHGKEFREGRITTQSIHDKISRGERIDRLFSDQDRSGPVEGIGRIGVVARIVVDGMIAAVVAVGRMITEYVLTIVAGAMAGATTN